MAARIQTGCAALDSALGGGMGGVWACSACCADAACGPETQAGLPRLAVCAGAPCGVISELLLCCSVIEPNRVHADYLVIASAARRATLNGGGRVLVVDAGNVFCAARLEMVLEATDGSHLTSVLGAVDVCRADGLDSLCESVRCAYPRVAAGRCRAVFVYGLAGLFRPTRGVVARIRGVLCALDDMASDLGPCVVLFNHVHARDGGVFYTGPVSSGVDARHHLLGCRSANVVLVRGGAHESSVMATRQNWVEVDACDVDASGASDQ